jgi:hypothetical protein
MPNEISCLEDWKAWPDFGPGGPVTFNDALGAKGTILHRLNIPPEALRRSIWVAAGAFFQSATGDHWIVQGRLVFLRTGKAKGSFLIGDASSELTGPERDAASRQALRIRADGSGSVQPILRYENRVAGIARDNCDIAAFNVSVEADEVQWVLDHSYVLASAPGNLVKIITGLRVLSNS